MIYRLAIITKDDRVFDDFADDQLSGIAWPDWASREPNPFNALGYRNPDEVRHVEITHDNTKDLKAKARARWYRENRS